MMRTSAVSNSLLLAAGELGNDLVTASCNARSSRSSSSTDAERVSTRMVADSGMEFTEVPPLMMPMLKVVFGVAGNVVRREAVNDARQRDDGIGNAEVAPGVAAMTANRDFIAAAAQTFGNDGVGARAVQHHQ